MNRKDEWYYEDKWIYGIYGHNWDCIFSKAQAMKEKAYWEDVNCSLQTPLTANEIEYEKSLEKAKKHFKGTVIDRAVWGSTNG